MNFLLTWVAEGLKDGKKIGVVQKTVIIFNCPINESGDVQRKIDESYANEQKELMVVCMRKSRGANSAIIYHLPIVVM